MKATKLRRILVPIDFSPASLATLRFAKLLAVRFGAKLHLVHVIAPAPIYSLACGVLLLPFPDTAMVQSAKKRLQDLVSELSLPPHSTQCIVRVGAASAQINEAAKKCRADLLAIATRGLTGLKHAFLGSTTQRALSGFGRARERTFIRKRTCAQRTDTAAVSKNTCSGRFFRMLAARTGLRAGIRSRISLQLAVVSFGRRSQLRLERRIHRAGSAEHSLATAGVRPRRDGPVASRNR